MSVSSGAWTCVAMNKWGTANQTVVVPAMESKPELLNGEKEHASHRVIQGLPLILECRVGLLNHRITWTKDQKPLVNNSRITIRDNNNSLIIWETTLQDSGTYTCVVEGTLNKFHHVAILEPPQIAKPIDSSRIVEDSSILRISALKGHSTVLSCPITGTPQPKITWSQLHFKPDRHVMPIPSEGRNLSVLPQEATEFYQCSGVSSLGHLQVVFELSTESRPMIKNPNSVNLSPKLFSSILLPCWTDGIPLANITWYRNTKLLTPSLRVRISANAQVVRISNIRSEDNGVYSCNAKNYLGTASKMFSVQVSLPTLLSPWSKWSNCSESCGLGTRHRTRDCLYWNGDTASTNDTPQCAGDKLETEECLITECPVDGVWSEWTAWSPCSATCKSPIVESPPSIKYRHRDCSNPAPAFGGTPCKGTSYQQEICEVPVCPIDGGWSIFSNWSTCSVACGVGMQVRNRICNDPVPQFNGRECDGESYEVKHCNDGLCAAIISQPPPPPPSSSTTPAYETFQEWSLWSEWSECTAICGSGLKSRTRKCLHSAGECAGENIEFQQCEGRQCEARYKEEETYRWFFNPQASGKFQATASASHSSEETVEEGEDDDSSSSSSSVELTLSDGPEKLSQRNLYFNPQVSITLESSIPLTKDVSKIHFASQGMTRTTTTTTTAANQRDKSCELGFEFRDGYCEGEI